FDFCCAGEDAELEDAPAELKTAAVTVTPVRVDLATTDGVNQLYATITSMGRPDDAMAVNAGIGDGGASAAETSLDQELEIVDLNCRSTVHLTKLVVGDMVRRRAG